MLRDTKDDIDIIDNNEFLTDPLISEITNKMFEIRQITNNKRMATPPVITANINKGLDVLLQAIDEMDNNTQTSKKQQQQISKRKNGELFIASKEKKKENNNIKNENNEYDKIRNILGLNYNCFKLNLNSTLIKQTPNDISFKNKLELLSKEFNDNYNNGLLQVYKTCNHKLFKDKFIKCNRNINQYYNIWNQCIKLHLISQLNQGLKHYKIKETIGLIFAIMDHLFSYKLYKLLCNINNNNNTPLSNANNTNNKEEKDIYLPTKGNL
eukprot:404179_1